jgi:RNA polymerase sigma-70 factor (ECF subfamily)
LRAATPSDAVYLSTRSDAISLQHFDGESRPVNDHATTTDEVLVEQIQQGDRQAFRALVERYQRRVLSVVLGMVRNREDALDIVQETFIKVHRHINNFKGTSSLYTWLYRIAVNLSIDHIRKTTRHQQLNYDDALQHDDSDSPQAASILPSVLGIDPAKVYQRQELLEQIEVALAQLSDKHRSIIMLREVQGLSYTEIADILEISKGTVMSRLHHARKNLQECLTRYLNGSLNVD